MADFVAVLRKTIEGLGETTPDTRRKVYDKARATIAGKLAQINPPPPPAVAERQKRALEDAIILVEAEHKVPLARKTPEPVDDLETIFASLKDDRPRTNDKSTVPAALAAAKPARTDHPLPSGLAGTAKPKPAPPQEMYGYEPRDEEPQYRQEEEFYPAPRRRRSGGLIAALVILLVLAGAAYGVWFKRQDIATALGVDLPRFARVENASLSGSAPAEQPAPPAEQDQAATTPPAAVAKPPTDDSTAQPPVKAPAADEVPKFTQRLAADGTESDPGPAGGEVKIGEGTTVAAATTPPAASVPDNAAPPASTAAPPANAGTQPPAADTTLPPANSAAQPPVAAPGAVAAANSTTAAPANDAAAAALPVGQRAIFYEERTSGDQGSAQTGSIVWSLVKESPGGDLPPEPAIRAEATIPGKDLQLRMTIRRNTDQTLPASHIIELIFLTPDNFAGGGIDGVLRFAMKDSEEAAGSPLLGIPAKISDGFFLVALNDDKASIDTNLNLLRQQNWIDIPIVYKSGRRALMTMEKGIPGDKVFQQALQAWQGMAGASSSTPPASTSGTGTSG